MSNTGNYDYARTSINRAVGCPPPPEFASIYEAKQTLATVQKQRFVCWMSGDCPNPGWTLTNVVTTGTLTMSDAINGGMIITTGGTNCSRTMIEWCDIRHFDGCGTGAVAIFTMADTSNSNSSVGEGFFNNNGDIGSSLNRSAFANAVTTVACFRLVTGDGTTLAATVTGVSRDANPHAYKLEINACDTELTVDGGCVDATESCRQVGAKVSPYFAVFTFSGGAKIGRTTYYEAYNK